MRVLSSKHPHSRLCLKKLITVVYLGVLSRLYLLIANGVSVPFLHSLSNLIVTSYTFHISFVIIIHTESGK